MELTSAEIIIFCVVIFVFSLIPGVLLLINRKKIGWLVIILDFIFVIAIIYFFAF